MSWFNVPLIEQATSENIPNGEQNIALNLDICDQVRSKKIPPQEALKQVKRRLFNINPNVQILALHLLDLLVKNGGQHFLEAMSGEFLAAYAGQIRSQTVQGRDMEVVSLMLEYLQQWAHMTRTKPELSNFQKTVDKLRSQNFEFPEAKDLNGKFIESSVAPEWVDSDTCMKSGQPFTFYNRKHHCRNCGGVYLQEFCKDFVPLPQFGIMEPVRVCVDCREKLGGVQKVPKKAKGVVSNNAFDSAFDRDLQRALDLSMGTGAGAAGSSAAAAPLGAEPTEMDEDMKAAIAASLADMQHVAEVHHHTQQQQHEPQGPPTLRQIDQGLVNDEDMDRVAALRQLLQNATPQDAIYDPRIGSEERYAVQLQPKVVKDLGDAADKLQTLEDLHSRIQSISAYYDRFLDAELQRAQRGRQPAHAQNQAHTAIPARSVAQGRANVPSYAPSYAPTYSQPLSQQGTGVATPESVHAAVHAAVPAPAPAAAPENAPMHSAAAEFPSIPTHEPAPEAAREPSPEPMLIDL